MPDRTCDTTGVMSIADNLADVRARLAEAAARAGRAREDVTLVAVSKTFPAPAVAEAAAAGQLDFGENRVEEALPKMAEVGDARLRWHMIGHVQSRKARDVAGPFELVHSVDSVKLARRLNEHAAAAGRRVSILLECNVSGESNKDGFLAADWRRDPAVFHALAREVELILGLSHTHVRGLMTMAPVVEAPDQARPYFAALRGLRDALRERFPLADWSQLSMGMTDDFEAAIAEGATIVRIGRAIFGSRA